MKPYYQDGSCVIYHGDWREVPEWSIADVLITDPPYGIDFRSGWTGSSIAGDADTTERDQMLERWGDAPAIVFGSPRLPAPANTKARLIWHRPGSGMGDLSLPWAPDYEMIYVLGRDFTGSSRGSSVLTWAWDVYRGNAFHPHQKPVNLMRDLIAKTRGLIADPFMGSGSTLRAAKDERRWAVGVEREERYCEIAAKRLAQEVLDFGGAA